MSFAKRTGKLCLLYLTFSISLAAVQNVTGRFDCPEGWTEYQNSCFFVSNNEMAWSSAQSTCSQKGGYLVNILTMTLNNFIMGLLTNDSTAYWIGLKRPNGQVYNRNYGYQYSYGAYTWFGQGGSSSSLSMSLWSSAPSSSSTSEYCASMKHDGLWYPEQSCSTNLKYICQATPDCVSGWTGTQCNQECHCAAYRCGKQYSSCPFGCNPGWKGTLCDQAKQVPEVVYYCQNIDKNSSRLLMRIDTRGVNYANILALDEDGAAQANCGKSHFTTLSNPSSLSISVPAENSDICEGIQVPNTTSTYKWTFWMAEFPGILSDNDYIFSVTCDFTQAETMQRVFKTKLSSITSSHVVPLTKSDENVQLKFVGPDTTSGLQELKVVKLGTRARLVMTLFPQPGIHAKGISPKNCVMSSVDGRYSMQITDSFGCSTGSTPISKLSGNGTLIQSEVFSIFTFRDVTNIVISCGFDFCFSDNDGNCTDRCSRYPRTGRGKRSARDPADRSAVAHLQILPNSPWSDSFQDNLDDHGQTSSRFSSVAVIVTVVIAVSMIVMLFSVFFICNRGKICLSFTGWMPVPLKDN